MDTPRTREDVSDHLETLTNQISEGIQEGRYSLSQLQEALVSRTKRAASSTDELIHDYPWSAMGVGVAIGILIGFLMPRR